MTAQPKYSYAEVRSQFETLREVAREAARESLPAILTNKRGVAISREAVHLGGLSLKVDTELKKWERSGQRRVAWDWGMVRDRYKPHPKRFELSVWYRDLSLAGASIGKLTRGGGKLRLDYLESSPLGTPLDGLVADISVAAAVVYAQSIGAAQLRIMNPVNEAVRDHYLSKPGFSYDQKGNFCYRDLV